MEKGTLVEFKLKGSPHLGVADRPEGKKNWVLIDQRGQSHTIHPRQVIYEVVKATYEPTEIDAFVSEAEEYIDPDNLDRLVHKRGKWTELENKRKDRWA